ncbi:MAG: hypothetical protein RL637_563 [Pseudomonadota bacterium]|jgi:class 3 adenylate cyclase/putative methionine-R-sulfoxide reductase with GAF domain
MKIRLDRFIAKKETAFIIQSFIRLLGDTVVIEDAQGKIIAGNTQTVAYHYPIEIDQQIIGWVKGSEQAQGLARLLIYLIDKENDKKALAIETLNLYKEINLLYSISAKLTAHLNIYSIAQLIIEEATRLIDSDYASVMLFNEETNQFEVLAVMDNENQSTNLPYRDQGIVNHVFASMKAEIINDVDHDPRFSAADKHSKAMICVPIKSIEKNLGVFTISSRQAIEYTAADLKLFTALAAQAAPAIENVILHERKIKQETIKSHLERYLSSQVVDAIINERNIALTSEKRHISILFSDIRGFTATCELSDPSEIVGYLNQYFENMVDIIFDENGTVNKFVGDMIVALFGAPVSLMSSEKCAIMAAIRMQRWLKNTSNGWIQKNFITGIGINSGEVIIGNVGSPKHMDYTAIGDEVNLASRLQSLAEGGQILVSRSVWEATKNDFEFRSCGFLYVKGKKKSVDVYEVLY